MMMNYVKYAAALIVAVSLASASAWASGDEWMTNYKEALAAAKKDNKMLLMDFTGKGWCGWCTKLDKEVFSTEDFKKYAMENLVLLELDFQSPGKLDKALESQNTKLMEKYGVEGFPTIIVLNPADEKQVGKLGYMPGGPAPFIAELNKMKSGS